MTETDVERHELALEHAFTIARGTRTTVDVVTVELESEGTTGVGAAAPAAHYGETVSTVEAVLPTLLDTVRDAPSLHDRQRIRRGMDATVRDNPAAKAAVDVALFDWAARRADLPLYRYLGLDPRESLTTSYTVGIDDPDVMREKTHEAVERGYPVLKVKLGTTRHEEILETVRSAAPDATLRVDANEAWSPREAVRKIEAIEPYDVEFVEQPVPAEDPEGLGFVREHSPLPIAADESCVTPDDVPAVAGRADIVNLKLMKCGGVGPALEAIHAARAHGLKVMLGCMVESNASLAAACHLAPLLDYADLDGSLLLAEDPYEGVPLPAGEIALSDLGRPGSGARPAE
ncbi:MAG: dipeptide epimerase [Haloarculaceae archaeon]